MKKKKDTCPFCNGSKGEYKDKHGYDYWIWCYMCKGTGTMLTNNPDYIREKKEKDKQERKWKKRKHEMVGNCPRCNSSDTVGGLTADEGDLINLANIRNCDRCNKGGLKWNRPASKRQKEIYGDGYGIDYP